VSAAALVVGILLAAAVAVELLCCLGLLVMRNAFDRLHYLAPAATLGPVLLGAAVLVRHSSAQACIKIVLVVGLILLLNPVLTHVTARAARIRQFGHPDFRDDEAEKAP
jgi:multicomponent Na+:H+ antiporter subunit G